MKTIKVKSWFEVPTDFSGIVEHFSGTKYWYLNGKLHRMDGPAIEWPDGRRHWYLNGKYYQENGPAFHLLANMLKLKNLL